MAEYRILILAYDFPPNLSIGGQRPWYWAKYLNEHGVYPIIVTRHWEASLRSAADCVKPSASQAVQDLRQDTHRIIRIPFNPGLRDRIFLKYGDSKRKWIRKVLSFVMTIGESLFPRIGDKYFLYREVKQRIASLHVDAIMATGEPFVLHSYASRLGKQFNLPVVLDYRDGWTTNQENKSLSFAEQLIHLSHRFSERKNLTSASLVTAASPSYLKNISTDLMKTERSAVIYNGYDEEVANHIKPSGVNSTFTIAYAGRLYDYQRLESFLEGLRIFLTHHAGAKIKVVFYGMSFYPEMVKRVKRFHQTLEDHLVFTERIAYSRLMQSLHSADALLLLSAPGADWLSAKTFDYLPHKKPILLVEGDQGVLERILEETSLGFICNNANDVSSYIKELYEAWVNTGKTEIEDASSSHAYTRQASTKQLADYLLNLNCV
jgi:glycosyltransferase involved in cell wall biosynthesis